MGTQTVMLLLAGCLVLCLGALAGSTAYFLWQWRRIDRIMDDFEHGGADGIGQYKTYWSDVAERRESRVISRLRRILDNACYQEQQALREKDQVTQLLSDLSHQFKTPLANIVMDMELLQDQQTDEAQCREFADHAKRQADKLQWLMAALFKASRLENGMICFEAEVTGIKQTIARAVSAVYAQASAKQIELAVAEFEDCALYHNPKWTAEAMANILENAVKYAPSGSRVQITLSRLDLYTRITISDQGIGIPKSEYNAIFRRFYRGKEVAQQEGSGLGLYLAQLILQCEKGYITVASQTGGGSSFSIFLANAA